MPKPTETPKEPERTVCPACKTFTVARPLNLDGLPVLVCPKCGTLRAARPKDA